MISFLVSAQSTTKEGISQSFKGKSNNGLLDTQNELSQIIFSAKAQGYDLEELKTILRSQGYDDQKLSQIEELWFFKESSEFDLVQSISKKSNFNREKANIDSQDNEDNISERRFGSTFFDSANIAEFPELYIAPSRDYLLGPGDELVIQLYGASEGSYPVRISAEGTIKVDRLPPIFLSGLTIEEAERKISLDFVKIYQGLKANSEDVSKTYLNVGLQRARSIVINISGHVISPGTYTLSPFTSILNALYAAGGPDDVGTYRKVRLLRQGAIVSEIDLYDYFIGGKIPSITLQDQDVIQVPSYNSQIKVSGGFKTLGYFELLENETLSDLLKYSGGFSSNAFKESVFVSRINEFKRESITIRTKNSNHEVLKDGDIVNAFMINGFVDNEVKIEGEVYVPSSFNVLSVKSVRDLINASGGLTSRALPSKAILFNSGSGLEPEMKTINLNDSIDLSVSLRSGDRLFVPSKKDILTQGVVSIGGEIKFPGDYEYNLGMDLTDLLILSGGFTANADTLNISLYRLPKNLNESYIEKKISLSRNFEEDQSYPLLPNDYVVIRKSPLVRDYEVISVEGYVGNPGDYILNNSDARIYDIIQKAGGFLKDANISAISISRSIIANELNNNSLNKFFFESIRDSLDVIESADFSLSKFDQNIEKIRIPIDGERLMKTKGKDLSVNIVMQDGDIVSIPKYDNTITVLGKVQQNVKFSFDKSMTVRRAISNSGGFVDDAARSQVYVVYQNGKISSRKSLIFGLVRIDPKLKPGSTIIIPKKEPRQAKSILNDILGYTSTFATLTLLIRQMGI